MVRDDAMMRRGEVVQGLNAGNVEWVKPRAAEAAVDMWIGLPRSGWAGGAEKWDFEQGRVPGPEEGFEEERAPESQGERWTEDQWPL